MRDDRPSYAEVIYSDELKSPGKVKQIKALIAHGKAIDGGDLTAAVSQAIYDVDEFKAFQILFKEFKRVRPDGFHLACNHALHFACGTFNSASYNELAISNVIKELLHYGANPQSKEFGPPAIALAVARGNLGAVEILIEISGSLTERFEMNGAQMSVISLSEASSTEVKRFIAEYVRKHEDERSSSAVDKLESMFGMGR